MDATLQALAALAVDAIPTVLFFIFLTFYLKKVFFQPVSAILAERRKQTEGMRELAEKAHLAANQKTSEFETAIQLARAEILQENDAQRRAWAAEQSKAVAAAREQAEQQIAAAKIAAAKDLESAKSDLAANIGQLSSQIVAALTKRRAA